MLGWARARSDQGCLRRQGHRGSAFRSVSFRCTENFGTPKLARATPAATTQTAPASSAASAPASSSESSPTPAAASARSTAASRSLMRATRPRDPAGSDRQQHRIRDLDRRRRATGSGRRAGRGADARAARRSRRAAGRSACARAPPPRRAPRPSRTRTGCTSQVSTSRWRRTMRSASVRPDAGQPHRSVRRVLDVPGGDELLDHLGHGARREAEPGGELRRRDRVGLPLGVAVDDLEVVLLGALR